MSFTDFDPGVVNQAISLTVDYSYFDFIPAVKDFISVNKKEFEMAPLAAKDIIKLNPLSSILDTYAEVLYEHPLVKQYITMKFKQDFILGGIVLSLVIYCLFLFFLNVFAFSLQPAWQLLSNQNSNLNYTIEPFCTDSPCQGARIATGIFMGLYFIKILIGIYQSRTSYYDQSYLWKDYQITELFHFGVTLAFLITGNWYCGMWALIQGWFSIPGMIIRLDGGTKIILIHRVFQSAISIFHILLFFICGTGSIFILCNGSEFSFNWLRILPKALAIITGEFDIDNLMVTGSVVFGPKEIIYTIFLLLVIFCCNIVLMNVFTGLAVGEIASVMSEAEQIKARYQMKLVANYRSGLWRFRRNENYSKSLVIKIVNSEEYGFFRRAKNIIRKHYMVNSNHFLMRKAKISQWMTDCKALSNELAMETKDHGNHSIDGKIEKIETEIKNLKHSINSLNTSISNLILKFEDKK